MKLIRNMAFSFGGKFYATQGGPLRPGFSVSEEQVPADWDTKITTNYPKRISEDTVQFTLIDSDACGITGDLGDFDSNAQDALCAKPLTLYVVIGDETSGADCDKSGDNYGKIVAKSGNAYITNFAPNTVTVDGERTQSATVTFRFTTPFVELDPIPNLKIKFYKEVFSDNLTTTPTELNALYGEDMPQVSGAVTKNLVDCNGKIYYKPEVSPGTGYVPVIPKFDRLVPISLFYAD